MSSRFAPTGHGHREEMPSTAHDFIAFLERRFGETKPRPGQTLEEIMFAAGQRSVALLMRAEFDAASNPREG